MIVVSCLYKKSLSDWCPKVSDTGDVRWWSPITLVGSAHQPLHQPLHRRQGQSRCCLVRADQSTYHQGLCMRWIDRSINRMSVSCQPVLEQCLDIRFATTRTSINQSINQSSPDKKYSQNITTQSKLFDNCCLFWLINWLIIVETQYQNVHFADIL